MIWRDVVCLVTPRFVSGIASNSLDCDEAVRFIRLACMFRVIYFWKVRRYVSFFKKISGTSALAFLCG